MQVPANKNEIDPRSTLELLKRLKCLGLDDKAFRRLHHLQGSIAGFGKYCENTQRFREDGNNHRVHQRLRYVLSAYLDCKPPKGKNFERLAIEAMTLIPKK